ncbi:protein MIZU-KUSSEI 1-like [Typha latifolia]|uniref:protein MIZU-KUSSEI 1-like n=1 Tax=Typha latifolia TaxID=4733 RepID=UPI003C309297
MRTIMAKSPYDSSFSFSKRHFHRIMGHDDEEEVLPSVCKDYSASAPSRKRGTISRLRSALTSAIAGRRRSSGLGPRVTGTLFGHRRGHVHFAFQVDPRAAPVLLLELATPTSTLVREMASGLVRIALVCEKKPSPSSKTLLEEPLWRAYCNGIKCGFAVRRECSTVDWGVLKAVEPVSMGAGVIPSDCGGGEGEMMYMRAKFERVVGTKDSEAFYMMNPDSNGGPELSIYLLRV